VFLNRAALSAPRDVLNRFSPLVFAVLVSAAGTVCALVNVACYREVITGRYLFPLALPPWLVFGALIWAFYRPAPVLLRGFRVIPALVASLIAVALAWPKRRINQKQFSIRWASIFASRGLFARVG
jgi:hypothetical protein